MISVTEIMTPRSELVVMAPEDSVEAAARAMAENGIHHIPVVDADGILTGLVSHRDVLAATAPRRPGAPTETSSICLGDIMSTRLETVLANCGVRHAARRLQAERVGCLPVMDGGRLIGVVTDTDFVSVAIHLIEQLEEIEPVRAD